VIVSQNKYKILKRSSILVKTITGLFVAFNNIENNQVASKPIPAEFEVIGFYFKYEKHFVYWKYLDNGDIGIVTILHEKMHQIKHFSQLSWKNK